MPDVFAVVTVVRFVPVERAAVFLAAAARAAEDVRAPAGAVAGSTLALGVGSTTTSAVGAAFSAAALVGAAVTARAAGFFGVAAGFFVVVVFAVVLFAVAVFAVVLFAVALFAVAVFAAVVFAGEDFAGVAPSAPVAFPVPVLVAPALDDAGVRFVEEVVFFAVEAEAGLLAAGFRTGAAASVGVSAPSAWEVGSSGEEVTVLRYQRVAESQGPTRRSAP
ncbi:hypothetical protein [Zhihengliuella sp. ISTPL4]|uniref:hypothetical protein n=1 Tax=Zhihengliuella sp. ISTPL4 TaxID=2058657 RepID=UPI000C7E16BE|nr:hypothetical protein [Zhihengliuella sp. ISTPL4]